MKTRIMMTNGKSYIVDVDPEEVLSRIYNDSPCGVLCEPGVLIMIKHIVALEEYDGDKS